MKIQNFLKKYGNDLYILKKVSDKTDDSLLQILTEPLFTGLTFDQIVNATGKYNGIIDRDAISSQFATVLYVYYLKKKYQVEITDDLGIMLGLNMGPEKIMKSILLSSNYWWDEIRNDKIDQNLLLGIDFVKGEGLPAPADPTVIPQLLACPNLYRTPEVAVYHMFCNTSYQYLLDTKLKNVFKLFDDKYKKLQESLLLSANLYHPNLAEYLTQIVSPNYTLSGAIISKFLWILDYTPLTYASTIKFLRKAFESERFIDQLIDAYTDNQQDVTHGYPNKKFKIVQLLPIIRECIRIGVVPEWPFNFGPDDIEDESREYNPVGVGPTLVASTSYVPWVIVYDRGNINMDDIDLKHFNNSQRVLDALVFKVRKDTSSGIVTSVKDNIERIEIDAFGSLTSQALRVGQNFKLYVGNKLVMEKQPDGTVYTIMVRVNKDRTPQYCVNDHLDWTDYERGVILTISHDVATETQTVIQSGYYDAFSLDGNHYIELKEDEWYYTKSPTVMFSNYIIQEGGYLSFNYKYDKSKILRHPDQPDPIAVEVRSILSKNARGRPIETDARFLTLKSTFTRPVPYQSLIDEAASKSRNLNDFVNYIINNQYMKFDGTNLVQMIYEKQGILSRQIRCNEIITAVPILTDYSQMYISSGDVTEFRTGIRDAQKRVNNSTFEFTTPTLTNPFKNTRNLYLSTFVPSNSLISPFNRDQIEVRTFAPYEITRSVYDFITSCLKHSGVQTGMKRAFQVLARSELDARLNMTYVGSINDETIEWFNEMLTFISLSPMDQIYKSTGVIINGATIHKYYDQLRFIVDGVETDYKMLTNLSKYQFEQFNSMIGTIKPDPADANYRVITSLNELFDIVNITPSKTNLTVDRCLFAIAAFCQSKIM